LKLLLIFLSLFTIFSHALPNEVQNFINNSTIKSEDVSIYIKEVGRKNPLISLNADKSHTPASVIKVLSTYASLLKLGFDYRIPTKFYVAGSVRQGILYGDIVVKGFGDPTLDSKDLDEIVKKIYAKGIRKITGNIIIDRSYFRVGTKDNSGFDENKYSPYNAMPDAMMFNERISTICVTPNQNKVLKKTADNSYRLINKLQRVNKPCRGRYSWPGVRIDTSSAVPSVLLQGKISKKCGKRNICKVITKPYKSFYYAFKEKLNKEGIRVKGNMRLRKVPSHAKLLLIHYSDTLEKIVARTAKKSNNLYARHLLLTLGAKMYGAPATVTKGRRAVESILRSRGALGFGNLKIDNGSGLSRTAKITAKLLSGMFEHAYKKYAERWAQTLSIAGIDGTIKRRFKGTIVKNRAWMKTGTLKRVKNIGGYVKSKSGKLYTAVILVQSNRGNWRASKLQNDIIKWLVNYKGYSKPTQMVKNTKIHELMDFKTNSPDKKEGTLY